MYVDISQVPSALAHVDFETLIYLAGLFVLISACSQLGLMRAIGSAVARAIESAPPGRSRLLAALALLIWISASICSFLDNTAYTIAMVEVIRSLAATDGGLGLPVRSPGLSLQDPETVLRPAYVGLPGFLSLCIPAAQAAGLGPQLRGMPWSKQHPHGGGRERSRPEPSQEKGLPDPAPGFLPIRSADDARERSSRHRLFAAGLRPRGIRRTVASLNIVSGGT